MRIIGYKIMNLFLTSFDPATPLFAFIAYIMSLVSTNVIILFFSNIIATY